jgi:hypothetical protein
MFISEAVPTGFLRPPRGVGQPESRDLSSAGSGETEAARADRALQ